MASKNVINLEKFSSLTGDIGYYSYKAATEFAKSDDDAEEMKSAFLELKKPLGLPAGNYELDLQARGYVSGTMKVTANTAPNDILCAIAKYFKGHSDTYMDSLEVDIKEKVIKAEFGT